MKHDVSYWLYWPPALFKITGYQWLELLLHRRSDVLAGGKNAGANLDRRRFEQPINCFRTNIHRRQWNARRSKPDGKHHVWPQPHCWKSIKNLLYKFYSRVVLTFTKIDSIRRAMRSYKMDDVDNTEDYGKRTRNATLTWQKH